jgi:hypothetical protein
MRVDFVLSCDYTKLYIFRINAVECAGVPTSNNKLNNKSFNKVKNLTNYLNYFRHYLKIL